nr:hypothetical protein [Campylobacter fetus]
MQNKITACGFKFLLNLVQSRNAVSKNPQYAAQGITPINSVLWIVIKSKFVKNIKELSTQNRGNNRKNILIG